MTSPVLGVALGDPGGIGPEVILRAFSGSSCLPEAQYVIFGSSLVLEKEGKALGIRLDPKPWDPEIKPETSGLFIREVECSLQPDIPRGPSAENGKASFLFFEEAVREARQSNIQGIVTAPISKKSWQLAGLPWRGHTEYLSERYPRAVMTFWSDELTVFLLSHHLPLKEALKKVKRKILLRFFLEQHQILEKTRPGEYEFLVAGLNPHAGEDGLLGDEEENEIIPAIREAREAGVRISGPISPDTIFLKVLGHPEKIVIALYHDQGLIGFKLKSFDLGVNVTLGMPFVRTSPDHGTAFDISGRGVAEPKSMVAAIRLAHRFAADPL